MSEHVLWTNFPKLRSEWYSDYVYCSVCHTGTKLPDMPPDCMGQPNPGHMSLEGMCQAYGEPIPLNHTGNNLVAFVITPLF